MRHTLIIVALLAGCASEPPQRLTPKGAEVSAPMGYTVYCSEPAHRDSAECGGAK